jgi:predicted DNA-binding protein
MTKDTPQSSTQRITVTLVPGQREILDAIATHNHTTLAFVIRQAVTKYIEDNRDRQIKLQFPEDM